LLPKGPGGSTYLSAEQQAELQVLLRTGLIEERFQVTYEVSGIWRLLDRLGWFWQVPAPHAVEM
jgi:transposase